MQFRFSKKITITCGILALFMVYASYWQYTRYVAKNVYIKELMQHLELPVTPLETALTEAQNDWQKLLYRRVLVTGTWDYSQEIILRNRKHDGMMGGFVLTPLKTAGTTIYISRGFIPIQLLSPESRKPFQKEETATLVGLIKESTARKLFAPSDPETGATLPRVDQWLRIDIPNIQKQIPYTIAPVYLEQIPETNSQVTSDDLQESKSNRDEILFMPGAGANLPSYDDIPKGDFPIPTYDTVIPAARHYSYIFEWAIMALMTIIIGGVLQLRRN